MEKPGLEDGVAEMEHVSTMLLNRRYQSASWIRLGQHLSNIEVLALKPVSNGSSEFLIFYSF